MECKFFLPMKYCLCEEIIHKHTYTMSWYTGNTYTVEMDDNTSASIVYVRKSRSSGFYSASVLHVLQHGLLQDMYDFSTFTCLGLPFDKWELSSRRGSIRPAKHKAQGCPTASSIVAFVHRTQNGSEMSSWRKDLDIHSPNEVLLWPINWPSVWKGTCSISRPTNLCFWVTHWRLELCQAFEALQDRESKGLIR